MPEDKEKLISTATTGELGDAVSQLDGRLGSHQDQQR
jgi:hypothetical protein